MDLIDRAAVLDKFNDKNIDIWQSLTDEETSKRFWLFCKVADALDEIPSVTAVPLDKLCEWLSEKCRMTIGGVHCRFPKDTWKQILNEWMEE